MGVASLVLGIISVVIAVFLNAWGWLAAIIGIIGAILGAVAKKNGQGGPATAGLVLSIIGIILGLFRTSPAQHALPVLPVLSNSRRPCQNFRQGLNFGDYMYPYIFIGNKSISTYGLCMVVGIILVFFLSYRYASKLKVNLYDMIITATAAVGSGLLGASVLYILVSYSVEEIINQIKSGNLQFLNGGLVYYGSLIGGIIGSLIAIKATKASLYDIEDSIIPYLPLGHSIGRIGCIMAGCCHGFEYNGLLAFHYSNSILGLSPEQGYFPIQLLEAVINTLIAFCLLWYRKRKHHKGELVASYLLLYSTARFFIEFLRGDEIRGHYLSVSTSQWISVVLFVSSLIYFAIVFLREMQNKKKLTN